jgi:uncharacterized protein
LIYLIVFLASVVAGFINTLAGSGSLLMLPILMSAGLSSNLANGSNRVAILVQSIVGTTTFIQKSSFNWRKSLPVISPAILGALSGALLATQLNPDSLKNVIGILLIIMLVVTVSNPKQWLEQHEHKKDQNLLKTWILMFLIGFYGGFIQGGVGIFILFALINGLKYSIQEANAYKLWIVFSYALPTLLVFVYFQQVDWFWGLFSAVGQGLGAYVGVIFATRFPKADLWTYRLLILLMLVSIAEIFGFWSIVL